MNRENYREYIYEAVRKENGDENHVKLITLLFESSFQLKGGKILHDRRALYPLLSLLPINLMVILTLYLVEDEERLKEVYIKAYGEVGVSMIDCLTLISITQSFTGNPPIYLLPNMIQIFKTQPNRWKYLRFLLGLEEMELREELPLVQKIDEILSKAYKGIGRDIKESIVSLISTNDKRRAMEILSAQVLRYKPDTRLFLMNALIDKMSD